MDEKIVVNALNLQPDWLVIVAILVAWLLVYANLVMRLLFEVPVQ